MMPVHGAGGVSQYPSAATGLVTVAAPLGQADAKVTLPQKAAAAFVTEHTAAAKAAEQATGIPATFMIAQAAHETGWGRKEIKGSDGQTSFNLYGIKAGANWHGKVVAAETKWVIQTPS